MLILHGFNFSTHCPLLQKIKADFFMCIGRKSGLAMFSLNIIAQFFVGQGCTIASSRVIFAYSRDGAIPGSRWWSKVDSRTKTPVNCVSLSHLRDLAFQDTSFCTCEMQGIPSTQRVKLIDRLFTDTRCILTRHF